MMSVTIFLVLLKLKKEAQEWYYYYYYYSFELLPAFLGERERRDF